MPSTAEVWQRGPVPGVAPLLMPVVDAFLQVQEDLRALAAALPEAHARARPGGAASIAFHVRHIAGATDRLLTYARGETLTEAQRAFLAGEAATDGPSIGPLVEQTARALDGAIAQVRATAVETLLEPRAIGRARLPTTVLGLLFHAAEHATRHAGQAITTARILAGDGRGGE